MAIIWFAITVFVYQKYIPSAPEEFLIVRIITLVILPLSIAFYYLAMPLISYCTLTDDMITIHKNAVVFRYKIKREELDYCRVNRRDLEFYNTKGKSIAIHLDWSNRAQVIQLIKKLQSFTQVYEGNSQRNIDLKNIDVLS
jgi:hypothetical protein